MASLVVEVREAKRLPLPPRQVARAIRQAAEVSQQRLADELGVTRLTLWRWEAGRTRPRGLMRLAYARLLTELQRAVEP